MAEAVPEEPMTEAVAEEPAVPDLPIPTDWPPHLAERMNFRRPPAEVAGLDGGASGFGPWDLYGAPCLVLVAIDQDADLAYACFDAGLFTQTFCLAAEDRGFATCVMATAVRYCDTLHAEIPAADGKLLEVPAGRLAPEEEPATCGRRELLEETGLTAGTLEPLGILHSSPGVFDEVIHLFVGRDLTQGEAAPEAYEDIETVRISLTEALEMARDGRISDGKTIAALFRAAGRAA